MADARSVDVAVSSTPMSFTSVMPNAARPGFRKRLELAFPAALLAWTIATL
jgi:hypothetical protein